MRSPEVLSALTTPFTATGELDYAAFGANLTRLEPLVDGVFVAGTTGEFLALEPPEHARLVADCLEVFGPQRVVVHVGAPSTRQSLQLTAEACRLGAVRFAAITPYYLPASTAGVLRHWAAIKQACGGELYGYVYPDVAVTDVLPADLPELLTSGIDGLKVSATASTRVKDYLAAAPAGFKLWSGNDADVPNVMAAGGTGTVSGVSGACPTPWAALREALSAGDEAGVERAQQIITQVVSVLGPSIAALKAALDRQGLSGGHCRMAIDTPNELVQSQISDVVDLVASIQPEEKN